MDDESWAIVKRTLDEYLRSISTPVSAAQVQDLIRLQATCAPGIVEQRGAWTHHELLYESVRSGIQKTAPFDQLVQFIRQYGRNRTNPSSSSASSTSAAISARSTNTAAETIDEELLFRSHLALGTTPARMARSEMIKQKSGSVLAKELLVEQDTLHQGVTETADLTEYMIQLVQQRQSVTTTLTPSRNHSSDEGRHKPADPELLQREWKLFQAALSGFSVRESALKAAAPQFHAVNMPLDITAETFRDVFRLLVPFPRSLSPFILHDRSRSAHEASILGVLQNLGVPVDLSSFRDRHMLPIDIRPAYIDDQFRMCPHHLCESLLSRRYRVACSGSWDVASVNAVRQTLMRSLCIAIPSLQTVSHASDFEYFEKLLPEQRPLIFERNGMYALVCGVRWQRHSVRRPVLLDMHDRLWAFPYCRVDGTLCMAAEAQRLSDLLPDAVEHVRSLLIAERFHLRRLFLFLCGLLVPRKPHIFRSFLHDKMRSFFQLLDSARLSHLSPFLAKVLADRSLSAHVMRMGRNLTPSTQCVLRRVAALYDDALFVNTVVAPASIDSSSPETTSTTLPADGSTNVSVEASSSGMKRLLASGHAAVLQPSFTGRHVSPDVDRSVRSLVSADSAEVQPFSTTVGQIFAQNVARNFGSAASLSMSDNENFNWLLMSEQLSHVAFPATRESQALLVRLRINLRKVLQASYPLEDASVTNMISSLSQLHAALSSQPGFEDARIALSLALGKLTDAVAARDVHAILQYSRYLLELPALDVNRSYPLEHSARDREHSANILLPSPPQEESYESGRMQVLLYVPVSDDVTASSDMAFRYPKAELHDRAFVQLTHDSRGFGWVDVDQLCSRVDPFPSVPVFDSEWESIVAVGDVDSADDILGYLPGRPLSESWHSSLAFWKHPHRNGCFSYSLIVPSSE